MPCVARAERVLSMARSWLCEAQSLIRRRLAIKRFFVMKPDDLTVRQEVGMHYEPSLNALALIHEFEQGPQGGMASVPYRDPADRWTIGWGHLICDSERFDRPLTVAQADALLRSDLERFAAGVNACVTVPITQAMFDALVCFSFNVGLGAFTGSTLLRLLNQRFYAAAAGQFERWNKATDPKTGQKVALRGLTRRRKAERDLFERDGLHP